MIAAALSPLTTWAQFILWRAQPSATRPGKTDKIPCDRHGRPCDAHNPVNWLDADAASASALANGAGIGFVLTTGDPWFCLDLDGCRDGDGWSAQALAIVARFPGAACEVSQSAAGLHIWGSYAGQAPAHSCRNAALGAELYTERRFIALGHPGATGDASTDCTAALATVAAELFPPSAGGASVASAAEWTDGGTDPAEDGALIARMLASRSTVSAFGGKASFADLWSANPETLGRVFPDANGRAFDASRADAALASHLAFWANKDCARMERMMRASALVRDKFDRADGQYGTYLRRTIMGAVGRQVEVLTDKAPDPVAAPAPALQGVEMSLLQLGTQDSVAQIFARQMAGKMLYNHTRDRWLEWDGTRWQIEATKKALNFARDLARSVNYEGSRSIGSASFCAGVEQLAKADPVLSAKGTEFDRDNYLLNTPGGTFDLRTNTLRPHDPADRLTMSTAVTPCPDGGAVFGKFLDEITMGDKELAEFLQVSLGACLSGAVESHWLMFWIGQGRNGKNTLGDLVQDAMGDYARKVPTSVLMAKSHEGHPTEIANLQGIRLALSSEINEGEFWHEARINEITGDATLSARFMRGDFFTFQRTHKHLIYGNHRPQLRTVGNAISSRLKIVPFKAAFLGREDADLPRRLRENLGYVLAWLIEGHRKWLAAGKRLPSCPAVEAESADYFAAQSTPEMWLAERVQILAPDVRPASQCPKSSDLYRDYANWKKDRGENPISQTRWAETMQKKFERTTSNGVRYQGLMLLPHVGNLPFPLSPNAQPSYAN